MRGSASHTSLRHRAFLALAASFMLFNLGYQLLIMLLPFYLTVWLGVSRDDLTWFTGGVTLFVLLALPGMTFGARRLSKRALYAGSMAALGLYLIFLDRSCASASVHGHKQTSRGHQRR